MESPASKADRTVAVLVAPFVLAWDVARSVFFFLCRLMEKLDPFAALGAIFGWIAPPFTRLARAAWAKTLSLRLRVKQLAERFYGQILRVVGPVVRAIAPFVMRVGRLIVRGARVVAANLVRSATAVRRFTEPGITRIRRIVGGAVGWTAAPIRRAIASVRASVSRGASRS